MAKNIDKPRPNLNQSNLEMLIFLKYNLRALAYEDVEDTLIPLNWTPPNSSLVNKAPRIITQPEPPSQQETEDGSSDEDSHSDEED